MLEKPHLPEITTDVRINTNAKIARIATMNRM